MEDRRDRTFGNAGFAVDTFLRMDKENGFTFVEAFHRANDDAVRVFAVEARLSNNMSHVTPFQARWSGDPFFKIEMIQDTFETELQGNRIHDRNSRRFRFNHGGGCFATVETYTLHVRTSNPDKNFGDL